MKRIGVSIILCFWAFCSSSDAYVRIINGGIPVKWSKTRGNPIPYVVNSQGAIPHFTDAVIFALNTWSNVPGANIAFRYDGQVTSARGQDYINGVYWNATGAGFQENVLASNFNWYYSDGTIFESDIEFNGTKNFTTDGSGGFDAQTVALHESGHSLGFDHEDILPSVMGAFYAGMNRNLFQTDLDGLIAVYPYSDVTPPTTPVVTDGGVYTVSASELSASWTTADPESGIFEIWYAIGTSPSDPGNGYVVGWTSAGTKNNVVRTGLSLVNGTQYYIYVKAQNNAGLWSQTGVSNGIVKVSRVASSPGDAKLSADNMAVALNNLIVSATSAAMGSKAYATVSSRSSGIALTGLGAHQEGDVLTVAGVLITVSGEKQLSCMAWSKTGSQSVPAPLVIRSRDVSGGDFFYNPVTNAGQAGVVESGTGRLSTTGLLVRLNGTISSIDPYYVYINNPAGPAGSVIRIDAAYKPSQVQVGSNVTVRGISSIVQIVGLNSILVRPRKSGDWFVNQ